MAQILGLPKLSPTMEEGVLVRWTKKEGDKVSPGDLVAEVETDKANMDFNIEDDGVLLKLLVKEGDTVKLHIDNVEQAYDATHGFAINSYNINISIEPGEHSDVTFVADKAGVFPMYCTEFCSALHLEMAGYLLVEPK